ncbi:MAG: hypothetical protein AAGA16_25675 [Cyanobacteria bacterium P01_E01_bin.35]
MKKFEARLDYVKKYDGIGITDCQSHRLTEIIENKKIKSVLVFTLSCKLQSTNSNLENLLKEGK